MLRKSQKQYDQSFILFSDFCVREELIDKPLVIGLDPVEKWEPGTLMLDQEELQKVDPAFHCSKSVDNHFAAKQTTI